MASDRYGEGRTHLEGLVRRFLRPERRDRYAALLETVQGRRKVRSRLAHMADLDRRTMMPIAPAEQTPAGVLRLLHAAGAGESCYVISENPDLDDRVLLLSEVLKGVVGSGFGTIISCMPGELAYYEGEEMGDRFLLRPQRS